jgi:hypothetical protein
MTGFRPAAVTAALALVSAWPPPSAGESPPGGGAAADRAVVTPADSGAALVNPGMGWVFHHYDNVPAHYGSRLDPSDTVDDFPGLSVVYLRLPWSMVEPEEGRFTWSTVDTPAQRWIAKGKQVAFRFSACESWMRWATPEWVQKAGAKGYNFKPGQELPDGPFWEPEYDDPVFLEKLDRFLAAAAARYDGDPTVAFIDVGSFGVWGEGHTYHSSKRKWPAATLIRHMDLHAKHFKKTLLAANDDYAGQGQETIDHALKLGMTLRDDSILVQGGKNAYFHAGMAQPFWPKVPVILESEHYGGSRDRGNWQDGSKYLQSVEEYHASYASIHWWPREFLKECGPLIDRINLRLGYRLQLAEASWPSRVRLGDAWTFRASWRNAGVAPCLPGGFPAVTIKDAKGGIAGVFVDEAFDVRSLPVGPPGQAAAKSGEARFALPYNIRSGTYDVFLSVGTLAGTPRIALPLGGNDGQQRYRVGTLTVGGDFGVKPGALERRGARWAIPLAWTIHRPLPAGVAPYFHFDGADGTIAFQGGPDGTPPDFSKAGTSALACAFDVPSEAKGKTFTLFAGLWRPDRLGREDERLTPDGGASDRRVRLGTLTVAADGTPTLAWERPSGRD